MLLRIVCDGALAAGDELVAGPAPQHGVTVGNINGIYYGDTQDLGPLYRAAELVGHWRDWADHRTVWHLDDEKKKSIRL